MILSLSFSSVFLLSSKRRTVQSPKRRIFLAVFLILPSVSFCTVTQNPTLSDTLNIELNSGAAQLSSKITAKDRKLITRQYHCPLNTFRCGDGSCIPEDWINDGEADCHDLSDEKIVSSKTLIRPTIPLNPTTVEETFDDPFDRADQLPPLAHSSVQQSEERKNHPSSGYSHGCPDVIQTRVNQCSTDLTDWIENLDQVDLNNSSVLNDEKRWRMLDQGCELLLEFRTCTETLNVTACVLPKSIELWNRIELYTCQLLTPSIKEYQNCFANIRNEQCPIDSTINQERTAMCKILASLRSDLRCMQKSGDCTANAIEVIEPLKSETDHLSLELACSYIPTTKTSISTFSSAKPTSDSIKLEDHNLVPYDILYMFIHVNALCSQIIDEVKWEPIFDVICRYREKLVQQKECFINASRSPAKCNEKPNNETVCSALEQFSNNIDCALRVMLDVCTVEGQNAAVEVQDTLSKELITHQCYAEVISETNDDNDNEKFKLRPTNARCSSEQENLALTCLVELVEVNRKVMELNNHNFLHEISQQNSTIISEICNLYNKYDNCIVNTVFVHSNGKRCAFNSPLNTLARIGLSPICSESTRALLQKNEECIQAIRHRTGICQFGLDSLNLAIRNMLQGIHGEAFLCNSYYLIRDAFECGEKIFIEMCSTEAIQNLRQLRQLVMELGTEEGCPKERPSNLDQLMAQPMIEPTSQVAVTCGLAEQKQFASCVQSITAFQPHPLAVIKQPKQIDEACKQFVEFKNCQANISCLPLWSKGMTAMFEFACGPGYNTYIQVRQCIRKTTTREHIRECIGEFSRSSPQMACVSSKKLLACSIPAIDEKCGQVGAQFVVDYMSKFVNVVDPTCKIGMQQNDKSIMGYNCTADQNTRIDYCAAPINELTTRIDELFQGGLQQFLANVKNLAPMFAKGCNLTKEFKECLRPLIGKQSEQQCIVSSCLIRAGDGICDQPDTAKAIDDNLACVFKQASIPEFGRCLRSTIATLKEFNLGALRGVLPKFVNCVEHIVVQRCGTIPINVLRAITAVDICPVSINYQLKSTNYATPQICDAEMQRKHTVCTGSFHENYRMLPISLLNDPSSVDKLCIDASKLTTCSYPICERDEEKAFNALVHFICIRPDLYKMHAGCLTTFTTSSQGSKCIGSFLSTESMQKCSFLKNVADCAAPQVHSSCGYEALSLSFEGMHIFANQLNKSCNIQIPVASVKTSCAESDIVDYLQCENLIDRFTITPFSFIRNGSEWDDFCEVRKDYEKCVSDMSCRVEPITSANTELFRALCGQEQSTTKYFSPCLTQFVNTAIGMKCSEPLNGLDLLAKESSKKICSTVKNMLSCAASELSTQCTEQALQHVARMLRIWVQKFDPSCLISGYGATKDSKLDDDFSLDSIPTHISVDQVISVDQTSSTIQQISSSNSEASDGHSSASSSFPELITSDVPIPIPEPGSTLSPDWRFPVTSSSSKTSPESENTENESTDSSSSLQSSADSSKPKFEITKTKVQGSGQVRHFESGLWILHVLISMPTLLILFDKFLLINGAIL